MQPVLARADILDITAVSKADPILSGQGNPYAIRLNSSNGQDGAVIADILLNKLSAPSASASSPRTTPTATARRP